MKQKCAILMFVLLMAVIIGTISAKKDIQQQKHDQEKIHKKPSMVHHWEGNSKSEHHTIKEVMKHAPHTVNHHEAKAQLDLGTQHGNNKKQLQSSSSSNADLKLQDLSLEENVHHKIQNEKLHEKHSPSLNGGRTHKTVHNNKQHHQQQHLLPPLKSNNKIGGNHGNNFGGGIDKKEKKAAKKSLLMSKNKKYKRAKRLHKFIW